MNKNISAGKLLAVTMAFSMSFSAIVKADTFKDVPSTHWAYEAVDNISSKGIIVGDLSGNFNPDSYIDKFTTSKILAKVAGYKSSGASNSEISYYNQIYENNKQFIEQYSKNFKKWNSTADKEIAYLLEKKIYKTEDLNQFVIKNSKGTEQLRALSREEAAVFLVRILGKENEASTLKRTYTFSDDSSITLGRKDEVYYLHSIGIISGDSHNKFVPKGAVTKATMAVLLDKTISKMNEISGGTDISTPTVPPIQTTPNANINNVETIVGTFDKIFPTLNVIQIDLKLYKISPSASIKINNQTDITSNLKQGMQVTAVLNNSEVIQLTATGTGTVTPPPVTPSDNNNSLNNNTNTDINTNINTNELTDIEGIIKEVNTGANTISIEYKMVSPLGGIVVKTGNYKLADSCKITRGGQTAGLNAVVVNDIANIKISGNTVYSIQLEQKDKNFSAVLVEKKFDENENKPLLIVKTDDNKQYEMTLSDNAIIKRESDKVTEWTNLRIGDRLQIKSEYNKINEIVATGTRATVEGQVTSINILKDYAEISIKQNGGKIETYRLTDYISEVYNVRIGDTLRLKLVSQEIDDIAIKKSNKEETITGYIETVRSKYIVLEKTSTSSSKSSNIKIYYDDDTVFLNSINGKKIDSDDLDEGMKIYVILKDSDSNEAKTITLLSKK